MRATFSSFIIKTKTKGFRILFFGILFFSLLGLVFRTTFNIMVGFQIPLHVFSFLNLVVLVYTFLTACSLAFEEARSNTLALHLTSPVSFWKFHLIQWGSLGLIYLSLVFVYLCVAFVSVLFTSVTFPAYYFVLVAQEMITTLGIVGIALSLGFLLGKAGSIALILSFSLITNTLKAFDPEMHILIKVLSQIFFYASPVEKTFALHEGISQTLSFYDWKIIAQENLSFVLYAGVFYFITQLFYLRRDYPIKQQS